MGEKRPGMALRRWTGRILAVALLAGGLAAVPQAGAHGGLARAGMSDARLLRLETQVLGRAHALEHLRARREARRLAAHPPPKVRQVKAVGPDSVVGHWSPSYHVDVTGIHATLLPTGKVLLISYGSTEDTSIGTLWDPVTHTGKDIVMPQQNIWCAGQTLLADGRVLVVGGNIPKGPSGNFRGLDSIWIFDPWDESWTFQGKMNDGRWYPTTTLLPDGRVVITSGLSADGSGRLNADVDVFTPSPDRSKPGSIQTVDQRQFNLYPRQFVLRDGRMLVAGPFRGDVGLLDPATWTWDAAMPQLLGDHYYGSAVLLPDGPSGSSKVMVIGGDQQTSTEVIDGENLGAGWSLRKPLPEARRNANSVLTADGAIITIGGNGLNEYEDPRHDALRYDPATDTWAELASQAEDRGYHSTALLLPDGRIVSAGDDGPSGGGAASDEIEIFSPPYLFKGPRPTIVSTPGEVRYGVGFSVTTSGEPAARAVLMAPGATTHANDMHQRLVPLAMTPGGAGRIDLTSPATRAIAPPGYYELVLVSAAGVPSEARFLRLGDDAPAVPAPPAAGSAEHGGVRSVPSTTGSLGPPASFAPLSYWRLGFENPLPGVSHSSLVAASHSGRRALWVGRGARVDSPRMVAGRYRVSMWVRSGPPGLGASTSPATLRLRITARPGAWKWRMVSATVHLAAGPERMILRLAPGGKAIVDDLVLRRIGA
jgi:hypothetical protein